MWEDETIDYGCENGSLVIDRKKGVQSVTYKCRDDGTYATPKGKEEGDPWPECTLKPVDPCEFISVSGICVSQFFWAFLFMNVGLAVFTWSAANVVYKIGI